MSCWDSSRRSSARRARVEGDRDALAYVGERLQETSEGIRAVIEQMDLHLTRKRP